MRTTVYSGESAIQYILDRIKELQKKVDEGGGGGGEGDMKKSVYDTNNNGIVDNAEKVSGYTVRKSVPSDAVFTDTTYSDLSEFNNDVGYVTDADVEAKGYLTEVPSEYVTDSELDAKGYLTEVPQTVLDEIDSKSTVSFNRTLTSGSKVGTITIDGVAYDIYAPSGGGGGGGDMYKSTYDTNSNGIVDNSEKVNGHTVNIDVPSNAKFTDTTYSNVSEFANDAGYITGVPSDYLSVTEVTVMASTNIAAEGYSTGTTGAFTNPGYYPLGVIQWESGTRYFVLNKCVLSSVGNGTCKIDYMISNHHSSAHSASMKAKILWRKI